MLLNEIQDNVHIRWTSYIVEQAGKEFISCNVVKEHGLSQ